MSNAPHPNAVAEAYFRQGLTGNESPEQLRVLADLLQSDPAHLDAKHPAHGHLAADLRSVYQRLNPEPEPIAPYARQAAHREATDWVRHPAYLDRTHKDHAAVVAKATAAFSNAARPEGEW